MHKLCQFLALAALAAAAHPLLADDGTGTSVSGSLIINGAGDNFFLAANGRVPAGFGNSTSNPTTIGSGIEFGFVEPGFNTDTADFTGTTLSIKDVDVDTAGAEPFEMDFTDLAFTGFTQLTNASGFTYSFSGDTLKVFYAGTGTPGTYTTTFSYTTAAATPEPSGLLLIGTGALGLIGATHRRLFNR